MSNWIDWVLMLLAFGQAISLYITLGNIPPEIQELLDSGDYKLEYTLINHVIWLFPLIVFIRNL